MGLPVLETCCFVFDLKTGNIIMGGLNAALSFTLVVSLIVEAASVGAAADAVLGPEEAAALAGLYAMSVILVFMFLAKLCADVIFIYGVVAERAGIIKAYCIMWIVFFLLAMFTFFINITSYTAWTITVALFNILFNVYAILLSRSYYKQLNMREEV
ncbi:hypothetical protein JYU34_013954 [Plutella xylostella]|uniref:Uncharacterized protein n=1 Tax=Plutella xylostella TaxID=51655 RepID=A0ABQ7QBH1_PLUXY|nr:uncharacterized protein LOC119692734 [Plutella xylostella]KAG7302420.1 hypothetical protein JYU34_013954 [Plutella xylostella]